MGDINAVLDPHRVTLSLSADKIHKLAAKGNTIIPSKHGASNQYQNNARPLNRHRASSSCLLGSLV